MFKLFVCLIFSLILSYVKTQICSFEQDIDYFGNDLSSTPIYLSSSDLCCQSCQSNSACQIWTYVPATTACWLKKSVGSLRVTSVGRVSGVKQASQTVSPTVATVTATATASSSIGTCSFEQDIDYIGNDLTTYPVYLTSSDLCCLTCQTNSNCQIWTYIPATSACWLKRQVGSFRVTSVGRVSGVSQGSSTSTSTSTTTTTTAVTTASSLFSTCSFEKDIDYFGNDLFQYPVYLTSSDLCCLTCQTNPDCQIWTYVVASSACWLKRQVGSMRISSPGRNSGVKQTSATGINAVSSTATPTTTKRVNCIIEIDINYPGNDLVGIGSLQTASDCCNYCGSTSGCNGWSFFVAYNYCFLKSSIPSVGNRESYKGIISGSIVSL